MKYCICIIAMASALLFCPTTFIEDCESPKAWLLTAFGCFAIFQIRWRRLLSSPVGFLLVSFAISGTISAWFSIDRHRSLFGDSHIPNGLFLIVSYVVFYGIVCQKIRTTKDRNLLVGCLVFTATVVSIHAIFEVFGIDFLTWGGFPVDGKYFRPPSTLGHPNYMSAFVSMVLPFALWFHDKLPKGKWPARIGFRLTQIVMLGAIAASQSRGAWIATIVSVSIYFTRGNQFWKNIRPILCCATLVFAVVFLSVPHFRENGTRRIEGILSPGSTRWFYSIAALKIWKQRPWIGIGTDAYSTAFAPLRDDWYWYVQPNGAPTRAHNEALNILATQGLLGFAVIALLTVTIWLLCLISDSGMVIPASASITSFYVFNLSGFPVVATSVVFMISLALLKKESPCVE